MSESPAIPEAMGELTPARVALGRSGTAVPTRAMLNFWADHALARDAVHEPFDPEELLDQLEPSALTAATEVTDRDTYLRRPDLGRRLAEVSRSRLAQAPRVDVAVLASDGLSATAIRRHGAAVVNDLVANLRLAGLSVVVVVVPFARVGLLSDAGSVLGVRAAVMVIGERPGLSAPDNLSIYVEVDPRPGHTDADRNCLSNIRPEGLSPTLAAAQATQLIQAGLRAGRSGTTLSIEFDSVVDRGTPRLPES